MKRAERNRILTGDSFTNFMAKLGMGTDNQMSRSTYSLNNLISRNRTLLEASYRSSWLIGQAVDAIAEDMTKMGINMFSKMSPKNISEMNVALEDFNIWKSLCETIKWARLYGGCIAVILIDGAKYEQPLDFERIGKDTFKGLLVLDRWMCEPSLTELVDDMDKDWGKPRFYKMHTSVGKISLPQLKIHYSRVLRFDGITLPFYQKVYENHWGLSIVERIYDRLIAYDSATLGAAQLVYKSFLRTIGVKKLREKLAMGGREELAVLKMFQYIKEMQTNEGITLLDAEDKFDIKTNSFGGLSDLLGQFGEQISGATGIPLVRLFGQSPAGFSTGETDLSNYYDVINREQENTLRPNLNKLLEIMSLSKFGQRLPDDFEYDFVSLWHLTDAKKAEINLSITSSVNESFGAGLTTKKTSLKELQQMSRVTGIWTNISDEEIQDAEQEDKELPPSGIPEGGDESEGNEGNKKLNEEETEENTIASESEGEEQSAAQSNEHDEKPLTNAKAKNLSENLKSNFKVKLPDKKNVINFKAAREKWNSALKEMRINFHDSKLSIKDNDLDNINGWVGVDFDATIAKYYGNESLGEPIPKMIGYVKELIDGGETVKIFTSRIGVDYSPEAEHQIKLWCSENGLPELEITNKTDEFMKMLLDDKLRQVVSNKVGTIVKDFKEEEHPRGKGKQGGEFVKKGTGSGGSSSSKSKSKSESESGKVKRAERGSYEKHKAGKDANFNGVKRDKDGSMKLSDGKALPKHLANLKMPPVYTDIKVNPDPKGTLLATAVAGNGKKQWFYSKQHDEKTTKKKDHMVKDLSKNFQTIDNQLEHDLTKGSKEEHEKALITKLVANTGIRIGSSDDLLGEKKAFGATTLESKHIVSQKDGTINLEFPGKKGVANTFNVSDKYLINQLLELKKKNKGKIFSAGYNDTLKYIKNLDGGSFTPKNFRTKVASDEAVQRMKSYSAPTTTKEYKKSIKAVAREVAARLNNTAGVCLKKYIVPSVWAEWRKSAQV